MATARLKESPEPKGPGATVSVGFRLRPEQRAEWDGWRAAAEAAGIDFRDWLFARIRQSLQPKPRHVAQPSAAARQAGYRLGLMAGRLDSLFQQNQEDQVDRGWVRAWAMKDPEVASDLVAILTAKPYGLRFHTWWQEITQSLGNGPVAHNPSARR